MCQKSFDRGSVRQQLKDCLRHVPGIVLRAPGACIPPWHQCNRTLLNNPYCPFALCVCVCVCVCVTPSCFGDKSIRNFAYSVTIVAVVVVVVVVVVFLVVVVVVVVAVVVVNCCCCGFWWGLW